MSTQQVFHSNPWGLPCVWPCCLELKIFNCKATRKKKSE